MRWNSTNSCMLPLPFYLLHTDTQQQLQGVPENMHTVYTPQFINHTSQSHAVLWLTVKCSDRNCLHNRSQRTNTTIKYFCSWQVNYSKTKLTAKKSLRQICDINQVCTKPSLSRVNKKTQQSFCQQHSLFQFSFN